MDDTKRDWVRSWMIKAHSDLRSARALAALPDPATDTALYHCQQSAEKALKAYLAFRDQPLERTHDLERLLGLAARLDSGFAALVDAAEALNPYATAFRYPGMLEVLFPPIAEATAAIEQAQAIYDFVLRLLPPDTHPA
jgi:HEPN domain-containing protein